MRERPDWRAPEKLSNLRLVRLRPTLWSYGFAQSPEFVEHWQAARWVRVEQACHWCWERIPVASPGASTGTRGTKAFCCVKLGLWRHIRCHTDAQQQELDDQRAALVLKPRADPVAGPSNETLHG